MISKLNFSGLFLGLVTVITWLVLAAHPDWAEYIYARKIYPVIANHLSHFGNALPIAMTGWIYVVGTLILLGIPCLHFINRQSRYTWLLTGFVSMLSFVSVLVFLLCITFMFNHLRYREEKLFGLDFELTKDMYQKIVEKSVPEANRLSPGFPKDKRGCTAMSATLQGYDLIVKRDQTDFLDINRLPALVDANVRYFYFSSVWSGMGISGQYQPLVGQANIIREAPVLSIPFIIAHERAHLNGFASEAGANLLAMQTLLNARAEQLRYLGLIELWRKDPPEGLNDSVKTDLQCIADDWDKIHRYKYGYLSRKINDWYLKLAGQKDGVQSYSRGKLLGLKYYYKTFVEGK